MWIYYQLQNVISPPKGKAEYCINKYFDRKIFPPVKTLYRQPLAENFRKKIDNTG